MDIKYKYKILKHLVFKILPITAEEAPKTEFCRRLNETGAKTEVSKPNTTIVICSPRKAVNGSVGFPTMLLCYMIFSVE